MFLENGGCTEKPWLESLKAHRQCGTQPAICLGLSVGGCAVNRKTDSAAYTASVKKE
jgi:hypothetical protein